MKRLWMTILLSCSASLGAVEKADFTLKWQAEKHQATGPIQFLRERDNKWVQSPFSSSIRKQNPGQPDMFSRVDKAHRLHQAIGPIQLLRKGDNKWAQSPSSFSIRKQNPSQPDMFGRVDKAHRLGYTDPNFSSFNSDGGY